MREMWVRGIFFKQVLDYIRSNRGQTTYELLEKDLDAYKIEEKYDFNEFGELLSKIKVITAGEEDYIARIARDTMNEEATWKLLFRRMSPASVFASTQRQKGRQHLADYESIKVLDGHMELRMRMWTENREHQDLWAEFYKGRLEGILDLIGHAGTVEVIREFGNGEFTYQIEWT